MSQAPPKPSDPLLASLVLSLVFAAIASIRLVIPSEPYFDEIHYLPAARDLLAGGLYSNQEHPLLGKELIALGMAVFGDGPSGWRIMPLLAGTLTLFSGMRAMWFATLSRFASLAFGLLLASGFALFVQSRIAMLDIFMACFLSIGAWQYCAAIREPETARRRLIAAGAAFGAAMACKWNAIPLAALPGLGFLIARVAAERRRLFTSRRGIPIPGISLLEAALWLGVLPLLVYALTFLPAWNLEESPLAGGGIIEMHKHMLALQTQVLQPHPYQSTWPEWMLNIRAIWYLYEAVDGAQRGIVLVGNPVTMLLGLPALIWCAISGITQRSSVRLGVVAGYAASLGLWLVAEKSVQFYYHYFVPSCFLLAALSLALDALWGHGKRWLAASVIAASLAMFAWFYPILSAAPLGGPQGFATWMWLDSWR